MILNDTDLELFTYMYIHGYKTDELLDIFKISINDFKSIVKSQNLISPNKRKKQGDLYFCPMCRNYKPKDNFYRSKHSPSGVHSYCKPCSKSYQKRKIDTVNLKSKQEIEKNNFKYCSKCKTLKHVELFNWRIKYQSLSYMCKECDSARNKDSAYKLLETRGY